jgi:GAF domain-containing protein
MDTGSLSPLRAVQLENQRLRDENQHLRTRLQHLQDVIHALNELDRSLGRLSAESNVLALIRQILRSALLSVDSEDGSLMLLDEETNELVFVDVAGEAENDLIGYRIPADSGVVGAVLKSRKPLLIPDVRRDPRWSPHVDESFGFQTVSLMCIPVFYRKEVVGAIEVVNTRSGKPFSEEDIETLRLVARLAGFAIGEAERFSSEDA